MCAMITYEVITMQKDYKDRLRELREDRNLKSLQYFAQLSRFTLVTKTERTKSPYVT